MDKDKTVVIVLQNVLAYDGGRPDEVFWERNHHKIHWGPGREEGQVGYILHQKHS